MNYKVLKLLFRPPFIRIAGFHVTYDYFYESLKPRGHITNTIMTMWTYQFNHNCQAVWKLDNNIVKKFAFSAMITVSLKHQFVAFVYLSLYNICCFLAMVCKTSLFSSGQAKIDPNHFEQESFTSALMRLDKTWRLSEMHLVQSLSFVIYVAVCFLI
jgi:hypothetical protein